LGRVIEVVSGTSYETFMEESVFGPLGMEDSGFFSAMWERRDRIPSFYRSEEDQLHEFIYYGDPIPTTDGEWIFPSPGFGLFSTAPDLGALLQMMLSGGTYDGRRILSRASVMAMTVDQIRDEEKPTSGLGWSVARRQGGSNHGGPLASSRAYGHRGATGVSVWVDPENDLAGAFLIHQQGQGALSALNAFMTMAAAAVVER
jgi:CubicO group peptidase (beta-lactamase class C family)